MNSANAGCGAISVAEEAAAPERLERRFAALWMRCARQPDVAICRAAWTDLRTQYESLDRTYHALAHIAFCLGEFDVARGELQDADAIEMAIWFHDIVMVQGAKDNEQRSAAHFAAIAGACFEPGFVATVQRLIVATTHRSPVVEPDEQWICDIDLASFGIGWHAFLEDCRALRLESAQGEEDYVLGKRRFYDALLARSSIFQTPFFRTRCEARARDNIRRFIAEGLPTGA